MFTPTWSPRIGGRWRISTSVSSVARRFRPNGTSAGRSWKPGPACPACTCAVHLRLPGEGRDGPTLELFQYDPALPHDLTAVNRPGFGHIAFQLADVAAARAEVLAEGGRVVGQVVTLRLATGAEVTWCYVTDPEGNVIELQSWRR